MVRRHSPDRPPSPGSGRLITRTLLVRFVSIAGTATSFYLLLSAVPLYARSAGASTGTAGLTTTALALSTVAAYLVTPRLMARYGVRLVLAAGLLALGGPALVLAVWANITLIMIACVIRGVGFAFVCVAGGALTVSLIPPQRRGEGLALVGIVSGIPSVAALPLGVWLAGHVGYRPLFAAGGLAALVDGAAVFGLGFGVTQNVTQTLMYDRVAESAYGAVSAVWNLAYDGGIGLGTAGFGVLAAGLGYPAAFALIAMLLPAALLSSRLLSSRLLSSRRLPAGRGRVRRTGGAEARTPGRSA